MFLKILHVYFFLEKKNPGLHHFKYLGNLTVISSFLMIFLRFIGDNLMSSFVPAVPEWIDLGASIIGGCCQTTPKDIQGLVDCVNGLKASKK